MLGVGAIGWARLVENHAGEGGELRARQKGRGVPDAAAEEGLGAVEEALLDGHDDRDVRAAAVDREPFEEVGLADQDRRARSGGGGSE